VLLSVSPLNHNCTKSVSCSSAVSCKPAVQRSDSFCKQLQLPADQGQGPSMKGPMLSQALSMQTVSACPGKHAARVLPDGPCINTQSEVRQSDPTATRDSLYAITACNHMSDHNQACPADKRADADEQTGEACRRCHVLRLIPHDDVPQMCVVCKYSG